MVKGSSAGDELLPVRVLALLEEPVMHSPVVILHDPEANRVLPIWIGEPEARAISIALAKVEVARPLTHTLLANTIKTMGGEVVDASIDHLESGTFYAMFRIDVGEKNTIDVDCRPSDAIALSLETGAPLFVAKSVMDLAGQDNPFPDELMKKKGQKGRGAHPRKSSRAAPKVKIEFSKNEVDKLRTLLEQARQQEGGLEG